MRIDAAKLAVSVTLNTTTAAIFTGFPSLSLTVSRARSFLKFKVPSEPFLGHLPLKHLASTTFAILLYYSLIRENVFPYLRKQCKGFLSISSCPASRGCLTQGGRRGGPQADGRAKRGVEGNESDPDKFNKA